MVFKPVNPNDHIIYFLPQTQSMQKNFLSSMTALSRQYNFSDECLRKINVSFVVHILDPQLFAPQILLF